MAQATVYWKWSSQGDGNKAGGAWAELGSGNAAHAGGGGPIIGLGNHAERQAWAEAWGKHNAGNLRARVRATRPNFPNDQLQVKFWVNQQICPTCQKWLLVDVISHLKQLSTQFAGLRVNLFAEVLFAGETNRLEIKRSAIWPVTIGQIAEFKALPDTYN